MTSSRSKYRDNQYYEYLINWLELRLSATSSHRPNSSDKLDLQRKMAYTQVVSQEIAKVSEILKETKIQNYCGKFSTSRGSSNIDLQDKVSRHSNALMKIKDELAQKIKQLDRLKLLVSEALESVDELIRMADLISTTEESTEEESLTLIQSRVEQKSNLVSEVRILYHKIQTDVDENNFSMSVDITKQMNTFEEKWDKLKSKCKSIGVYLKSTTLQNQGNKSSRLIRDVSQDDKLEGISPISQMSSVSCDTEAILNSRTTYSNSPSSFLSEEVVPLSNLHQNQDEEQLILANTLLHDIKQCLNGIMHHICNNEADVSQQGTVKELLRRYQGNLQEIDAKKTRMEYLINQLKDAKKDGELQNNLYSFQEHYDTSKKQILSRISELIQLISDAEQFRRRYEEILGLIESAEKESFSTNVAADSLTPDCDLSDACHLTNNTSENVFSHSTNITENKRRVKLFAEFSNKMILNYTKDDTSKVLTATKEVLSRNEALMQRYKSSIERNKAARANLSTKVSLFSEWLLKVENEIETLELDISKSSSQSIVNVNDRLKEIKDNIAAKDADFSALKAEEKTHLSKDQAEKDKFKLEGLTTRWKNMQNKILGITIHENDVNDEGLEKEDTSLGLNVVFLEQESWIRDRNAELESMVVAGDSLTIAKQIDNQNDFKEDVDKKLLEIQRKIDLYSKEECGNTNESKQRCEKVIEAMGSLRKATEQWGIKLGDGHMRISIFETLMTNLDYKINQICSGDSTYQNQKPNKLFSFNDDFRGLEEDLSNLLGQEKDLQVSLSPQNLVMLESLKDRVQNLINSQHEPETYCLPSGWERGIQDEIPYFINHINECTQWDHPVFTDLMSSLAEFNSVKFSAYRMALKLRQIQKKLCLEHLDLESAMFGFEMHGLTSERYINITIYTILIIL